MPITISQKQGRDRVEYDVYTFDEVNKLLGKTNRLNERGRTIGGNGSAGGPGDVDTTELQELQDQIDTLNNVTIPDLQSQLNANDADIAALNSDLDTLNNITLPDLQAQIDANDLDIAQNVSDIDTLETVTIPDLQSQIDSNDTELATLNNTTIPDLQSQITLNDNDITQLQNDLAAVDAGIEVVSSLPMSGDFEGHVVYLTIDDKLYRWNGTVWTSAVAAVDITGTITETQIADDSISTPKLQANAVTAAEIAANTITAGEIATNTITANEILGGTITAAEIAAGTITANEIASNAITTIKLNAGAVTAAKIAAGTITANEIAAGTITALEIAAGTITANEIAAGAITASEIATSAVTTIKLNAGAVTAAKIAVGTITATQIAAGTITASEIAVATITTNEIAADTILANNIAVGTITTNEIAADTITASNIAVGTITALEIAASTITANELNIAELNAITTNTGDLNVSGTLIMGTLGEITNAGNDFSITDEGLNFDTPTSASISSAITWGGTFDNSIFTVTSGMVIRNASNIALQILSSQKVTIHSTGVDINGILDVSGRAKFGGDVDIDGLISFPESLSVLGVNGILEIQPESSLITVQANSGSTDDLNAIRFFGAAPTTGYVLWLIADTGETITIKEGIDNIVTGTGDVIMNDSRLLQFVYVNGDWHLLYANGEI